MSGVTLKPTSLNDHDRPIGIAAGSAWPAEDRLGDLVAVDGEVQGLAHALVLHGRDAAVRPEHPPHVQDGLFLAEVDREAFLLQLLHALAADVGDVHLAAAEQRDAGGLLGHELEVHRSCTSGCRCASGCPWRSA